MPAVIATGSATDALDLQSQLVTWLVTRGYTVTMPITAVGNAKRAHLSKGSIYLNLWARISTSGGDTGPWASNFSALASTGLCLYLSAGFDAGLAWAAQPGGPIAGSNVVGVGIRTLAAAAITSYQFIDDGDDNIFVLVEVAPGIWRYLCWGSLTKYGSWTGGPFFAGSQVGYYLGTTSQDGVYSSHCPFSGGSSDVIPASFVRADIDAFISKWLTHLLTASTEQGWTGKRFSTGIIGPATGVPTDVPVLDKITQLRLVSSLASRHLMVPIVIYAPRDAGGYSAIGEVPSMRLCVASEKGVSIGTDVPVGAETWRIFPGFALRIA